MSAGLILSIIIVLAILYSGFRNGLFSSVATLLMLVVGTAISVEFYGPLASTRVFRELGDYAEPMCLGLVFVVVYFLLQVTTNVLAPPVVHMKPMANKLGGVGVSLLSAVVLSGFLGLVLSMFPWTGMQGRAFIGVDVVADRIGAMTRWAGGKHFDGELLFKRLRNAEHDRVCYQHLADILLRLTDVYTNAEAFSPLTEAKLRDAILKGTNLLADGASGGKGLSPDEMVCPCSNEGYVIGLLKFGEIPYRGKGMVLLAYDAGPCHELGGKPARMVLMGWLAQRAKLTGEVQLMSEEKFREANPSAK